jgi:hypothetical protein
MGASLIERVLPAQASEPREATIGRDPGGAEVDRQRGEERIGHVVALCVDLFEKPAEYDPVPRARFDVYDRGRGTERVEERKRNRQWRGVGEHAWVCGNPEKSAFDDRRDPDGLGTAAGRIEPRAKPGVVGRFRSMRVEQDVDVNATHRQPCRHPSRRGG